MAGVLTCHGLKVKNLFGLVCKRLVGIPDRGGRFVDNSQGGDLRVGRDIALTHISIPD
ncbi:MAG: hypothetical protein H7329_13430 [Opitutaceae bacterium]|nr:hypothetical protein [Cytophagales bacterium]